MLIEGQKFGVDDRYELIRLLGHGGFSEVWQVNDTMTHMQFAMKVFSSNSILDTSGIELFVQEFFQVFELNHTNLLKPTHFDVWNQHPYLIMPLCKNGSVFDKYLKGHLHITESDCWHLLHDVAAGLTVMHEKTPPVIHQDIKPDNILIGDDGQYMITDFGISVRIRSSLHTDSIIANGASGTIAYMPPEKFGTTLKPIIASDIWSLGAMLFELMSGYPPFDSRFGGVLQKNGADVPMIDGDYSEELKQLVYQCLSLNPWERPMAKDIKEKADNVLSSTHAVPPSYQSSEHSSSPSPYPPFSKSSSRWKKLVIGCILLLALASVVLLCYKSLFSSDEKETGSSVVADSMSIIYEEATISSPNTEMPDTVQPQTKTEEQSSSTPSVSTSQSTSSHPQSSPVTGKLDYAEWTGSLKNGRPDGSGKMTFTVSHSIDGQRMAQAGDYIENAMYENGELKYGTWCHQDGSIIEQIDN